jgi:hypothetical protein
VAVTIDDDRARRLRRTKLVALARDLGGSPDAATETGSATVAHDDGVAWVLAGSAGAAALATALLHRQRVGAERLVVFVDEPDGDLARLAGHFDPGGGTIEVRAVVGASSEPLPAAPFAPPVPAPEVPPELLGLLVERGLEVVVEHGVVSAEVRGLEVARLVRWPTDAGGDGELHLEAGVGRFDRDAVAAVHPDAPPERSLDRAVELVRAHRRPGATPHPIQRLARERWLRAMLVADPALVGARELRPVEMPTTRAGLKDPHPAAALGTGDDGASLVVVCSTGVDPALVPLAADARARHARDARLVLVVPERDLHPATARLAELLRAPAELRGVTPEWEGGAP